MKTPEPGRDRQNLAGFRQFTPQESADFVGARDLINAVIAVYSSLVHKARNEEEKRALREEQRLHVDARRDLTVFDGDDVQRIRAEYPSLLRKLRARDGG
ncbi:hypothetical protein [Streptomyces sp. NPDC048623]|uniref:hypothetical protein n=1 Tax=Streptomyces sp. NPDC048623 TaxID=3155761 RepID=UPI00343EE35D